jgi:hypothetical protein
VYADAPSLQKVLDAIARLKNGRAAGPDGIPPELLKCATGPVAAALHSLILMVWREGRVPAEWRDGIITALYKGKGSKADCGNYRPITLLSVPGKVFAHVLLARIKPLLLTNRRPQQSGFTTGRSAADAVLALRLLAEIHREFGRPLDVIYIDLKAAFDSVDRAALWKSLEGIGAPAVIMDLIRDLHTHTTSRVRVGDEFSPVISTTSGVRQGCVLAPDLFCRAIDWLMSRVKPGGNLGIRVGQNTFDDLDYADDGALLPSDRTLMTALLQRFDEEAGHLGLHVSWAKTKIQNVGHGGACPAVSVGANAVDSVNEFIYLGSKVTTDGHSAPEVMRRIALAASAMNQLGRVWRQRNLSLVTKLRLYESCVLSVLLYCAETWTLLKADVNRLQAFHMRSLRRILGIRWFDHVTNLEVKDRTRLEDIESRVRRRRLALFGHVARMQPGIPAHDALWTAIGARCGSAPGPGWKRPRGRPRTTWAEQLSRDLDGMGLWEAWYLAMDREKWREFATSLCCSGVR